MATEVIIPPMGESFTEGTIIHWFKQVGDRVEKDEPLLEITSDKVDAEIPAPDTGILLEVLHEAGETVQVGVVLARIGRAGELAAAAPAATPSSPREAWPTPAATAAGTALPEPEFEPGENVKAVPLSHIRRQIAEHLVGSRRTAAHVHTVFEVDVERITTLMEQHKVAFAARTGVKLTYTPFFARATVSALGHFPVINASLDGDQVLFKRQINLGIAVALDWGLIVPVVKGADGLDFTSLARTIHDLATRARGKKLAPDEVQGGTFTISNPGPYGELFGLPIIHQPQVAILGVGSIRKRPVVVDDAIAIRPMVHLSLSFDHRLIDGAVADQFMARLKSVLETHDWAREVS